MGLPEIEAKIREEASLEAGSIIEKAKREAQSLIKEAAEKAFSLKKELLEKGKKEAEKLKRALLTPEKLESRKKILEEKQRILDEVFKGLPLKIREEKEVEIAKFLYG